MIVNYDGRVAGAIFVCSKAIFNSNVNGSDVVSES